MRFVIWVGGVLFFLASVCSKAETFDLMTFEAPQGWARVNASPDVAGFSVQNTLSGSVGQIAIYKSVLSAGGIDADFEAEWSELVVKVFKTGIRPQLNPVTQLDGWSVRSGYSVLNQSGGQIAVLLATASGKSKRMSVLVIANSNEYQASIDKFMASIRLLSDAPVTNRQEGESKAPSVIGMWGKSAGSTFGFGDPAAYNVAGYSKEQYTFMPDGKYKFVSKLFRYSYDKLLFSMEHGKYQIAGNNLTLVPESSVIESWSKKDGTDKFGKLISSEKKSLERTTYQYTMHYFSGIGKWNLVLQADKPNNRDGSFSSNSTFQNAWFYEPISGNNTPIEYPER